MLKRQRQPSPPLDDIPPSKRLRNTTSPPVHDYSPFHRDRSLSPSASEGSRTHGTEHGYTSGLNSPKDSLPISSEYRASNNFLYEVHALHRHRLLFSPPCMPSPSSTESTPPPPDITETNSDAGEDESLRVKGRYEQTNRLLGSLFLSRRRELKR